MTNLKKMKLKDFLSTSLDNIKDCFIFILSILFFIMKKIIFLGSSFLIAIFSIFLPFGLYFSLTVIYELFKGVPLSKTSNWGFAVLFFVIPVILMIVNVLTKD